MAAESEVHVNSRSVRLLVVEDSEDDTELILRSLRRGGYEAEFRRVSTAAEMRKALDEGGPWDAVISDYNMPRFSGLRALQTLVDSGLDVPFIIVSGAIGEEKAAEIMRAGANDYVLKDHLVRLAPAIDREVREAKRRRRQRQTETRLRQAQKLEAIGLLVQGVVHDFNNLLTSIISFTRFVMDDLNADDPRREDLSEVLRAADSATRLTGQLLAFSRRRPSDPLVIDLNQALTKAANRLRRTLGGRIELVPILAKTKLFVMFDPGQLDQVIFNLVVNARDALPHGGVLTLRTSLRSLDSDEDGLPTGEYAALQVEDNGIGIAENIVDKIFDPFFSTKGDKGAGLGLSTCYGMIKRAGGDIRVASIEGKGTTFTVLVPLFEVNLQSAVVATGPATEPIKQGERGVALAVENQPAILQVISRALRNIGFSVIETQTAHEALVLAGKRETIDLLVTDLVLPRVSGIQLAEKIRQRHKELRVVLTSGYIDAEQGPFLEPRGLTAFLPKPFSPLQLVAQVERVCAGGGAAFFDGASTTVQDGNG